MNGPFAASYLPDYPESWYAHNAAGKRVKAVRFDNYLMDVHLPQWRAEVLRLCKDSLATSGYDGCFLDSLGNGIIKSGYLDSDPIDPRTNKPWTLDQYIKDTSAIAAYVRDRICRASPFAANGLGSGPRYYNDGTDEAGRLDRHRDGRGVAARCRRADVTAWPKLTQWRQNVDMIADAESTGLGRADRHQAVDHVTNAQRKQWYDFSLGSFLLGTGDALTLLLHQGRLQAAVQRPGVPAQRPVGARRRARRPDGRVPCSRRAPTSATSPTASSP